jgi:hypothetical protein
MDIIKALGADPADIDFYDGIADVAGYTIEQVGDKIIVQCPCAHCIGHNTTIDDEDTLAPIIDACDGLRASRIAGLRENYSLLLHDYMKFFRKVLALRAEIGRLKAEHAALTGAATPQFFVFAAAEPRAEAWSAELGARRSRGAVETGVCCGATQQRRAERRASAEC